MNTTVAHYDPHKHALSAVDVRSNVNLIQEVMRAVMQVNVHYGTIQGTDKPTLYKPGAEVLCATFRIAPSYEIEELPCDGGVRYRVRCKGHHQTTGIFLGEGVGACSSLEEKYKWRKAYRAEWANTPDHLRRIKYGWDRQKREEYEVYQVRTEPADLDNTVLKMAAKRALVAMVLNVTAASDIFTQDIEDLPEEYVAQMAGEQAEESKDAPTPAPRRKSERKNAATPAASRAGTATSSPHEPARGAGAVGAGGAKPLTEPMRKILQKRLEGAGLDESWLKKNFKAGLAEITTAQFNDVQAKIREAQPA